MSGLRNSQASSEVEFTEHQVKDYWVNCRNKYTPFVYIDYFSSVAWAGSLVSKLVRMDPHEKTVYINYTHSC